MKKKKMGRPRKQKDLFKIEEVTPIRQRASDSILEKAVNTVFALKADGIQCFMIPNNRENGASPYSLAQILRKKVRAANAETTIRASIVGSKKSPTGVRIWRMS